MKSKVLSAFLAGLLFIITTSALATTVKRMTLAELSELSHVIAVGEITQQRTDVVNGRVHTTTTLTPNDVWKGTASSERIVMRHLGGRTDELATRVAGMPSFTVGEKVLVFLVKPKNYKFYLVAGLAQGKLTIEDGVAKPNVGDLRLVQDPTTEQDPSEFHVQAHDLKSLRTKVLSTLESK